MHIYYRKFTDHYQHNLQNNYRQFKPQQSIISTKTICPKTILQITVKDFSILHISNNGFTTMETLVYVVIIIISLMITETIVIGMMIFYSKGVLSITHKYYKSNFFKF